MTQPTNPHAIAPRSDDLDARMPTPPMQPASDASGARDVSHANASPLDLDAWTPQRRAAWQTWLADKLLASGFASQRVDGRRTYWLSEVARQSGIDRSTLLSWLQRGSQPSYAHVPRLAGALGVQAIVVAYRAGLVGKRDLIALLHEAIPTVEDLHVMLKCAATMPDGAYRRTMEREAQRMLALVETLQRELGWTDHNFGPMAAEVAIRELANDRTPIDEHIAYADPGEAPRQPVYPGPTARYQAAYNECGETW
jgi:transcriptional regulator with XRE-family HTH domain